MKTFKYNRRSLLKGIFQGSAVAVGLPVLNCMLNENGNAWADGRALPVRFGTWSWGLGVTPGLWTPDTIGENYDLKQESMPLESVKQHVNILSGYDALLDGKPNHVHVSGGFSIRSGIAPLKFGQMEGPTFETLIAQHISKHSRFKSLDITATGNPADTLSYRAAKVRNTPEVSVDNLYQRIFGAEFIDPNAAKFTPDPDVMQRKSVLSMVKEQRQQLVKNLGHEDKLRVDQYFTSVREVEHQLALQLTAPPPAESCVVPEMPTQLVESGYELGHVHKNHELMTRLLALALTCNQTNAFNVVFSNSASSLHREGEAASHHLFTHEEITDNEKGYQVETSKFVVENMKGWATLVNTLANIPEGDGSLLDNCLVFAHSDTSWAKIHAVQGIPMMTAGKAGGRVKTGHHISSNGDSISRVGLTLQQIMGVPTDSWGEGSMKTNKTIDQLLA
ncbi:MAG: DUF1552 domain-containing protein [Cellvibrionaceae bacterium]